MLAHIIWFVTELRQFENGDIILFHETQQSCLTIWKKIENYQWKYRSRNFNPFFGTSKQTHILKDDIFEDRTSVKICKFLCLIRIEKSSPTDVNNAKAFIKFSSAIQDQVYTHLSRNLEHKFSPLYYLMFFLEHTSVAVVIETVLN